MPGLSLTATQSSGVAIVRSGARSVITRAYATSPLRLLTPANHGRAAWIYTSSLGGGLVDGDRLSLTIDVGPRASAFVTTQASTKVYRSPSGTSADVRARVHERGLLVVAPDPVVLFADARYRQRQHFDVAESGGLVVIDCVLGGRCEAGERWAFVEYRSLLAIRVGERLVLYEPLSLQQADGDLGSRFGRFNVLAVAVVIGGALRDEVRHLLDGAAAPPVVRAAQILSVAPLQTGGCILRIAGTSVEEVGRTLRRALSFVPTRLGDDPWRCKW